MQKDKNLTRLSLQERIEVLMAPLRQALQFYATHFIPLTAVGFLYLLLGNLIPFGILWLFPHLLGPMDVMSDAKTLLLVLSVILVLAPFQQATSAYFMQVKRSGQAQTFWTSIAADFWPDVAAGFRLGLLHWRRLFVVNLVRLILSAIWIYAANFFIFGLVKDQVLAQALLSLTGSLGVLYLFTRLAYFDFLIVFEQHSVLNSIKLSYQLTATHSGKLMIHLFTLSLVFVLLWSYVTNAFGQPLLELAAFTLIVLLVSLTQAICFSYFCNTRLSIAAPTTASGES